MAKIEKVEIFTKEGVMEKTLMYLYPHLEKIADGMATGARNKALLSFRNDDTALSQIEAVFFEIAKQRFLRKTAYDLSLIVEQLPEDEKFALEYCFFKRRDKLKAYIAVRPKMSIRTYYRKKLSALKHIRFKLLLLGMDEKWFFENFGEFDWAIRAYKKVLRGEERLFGTGKTSNPCSAEAESA